MKVLDPLSNIRVIAREGEIREINRLNLHYGKARWRKVKADATVLLPDGTHRRAEVHFYEAHGLGRYDFKVKRYL